MKELWIHSKAIISYAYKTRTVFFILIPIALGLALLDYLYQGLFLNKLVTVWTNLIDPLIGVLTLIITFSVWRGEVMQDWKNSIPKKLTVVFYCRGKEVMRCNMADLASEGDMRQLGQQIGRQMSGQDLKFRAPLVKMARGEVSYDPDYGFFRDYQVVFELTELPQSIQEGALLLWDPPFVDTPRVITDESA